MSFRTRRSILLLPVILVLALLSALPASAQESESEATQDDFQPPADLKAGWYARIETAKGRVLVRLVPQQAPQAVAHFVALARGELEWSDPISGEQIKVPYYDGTRIYRAWAGARIQAGDRTLDGRNSPMVFVPPTENVGPLNFYGSGRLGLARGAGGMINPTRLVLTYASQPRLHGYQPCIGEIIEGREVVFELSTVKTNDYGLPLEPMILEQVRVFKVGTPPDLAEPKPYFPERAPISAREPDEKSE